MAITRHPRSVITKHSSILAQILLRGFEIRKNLLSRPGKPISSDKITALEQGFNAVALKIIYKFNDSTFRPMFSDLLDWANAAAIDEYDRVWRLQGFYAFAECFFGELKSIVTNYAALILDNAASIMKETDRKDEQHHLLWTRVLGTLIKCFEHDQDDFWRSPSHFQALGPVLCDQFSQKAPSTIVRDLVPVIVELAAAADSSEHHKELNGALLKHLRSETAGVRLAAVKCEQALTDRLGEEWLSLLPEMLPYISELQEDDDELVEKETHRWIMRIEDVLGESLDAMLQ